jgi:GNAT superfamily N-acetyltransferase
MSAELRDALVDMVVDATNAGGAIGYVAPVDRETVDANSFQDSSFDGALDQILVGYEGEDVAAALFITDRRFELMNHTRILKSVMVHPKHQGKGYGVELMREAERVARTLDGVELLYLTCRGGLGLEQFYTKCGYAEVGRIPRALRVTADDYRDEVHLVLAL